jgi:flagellar biosynthesis protein FlhA
MKIKIGTRIKQLRKQNDITQEKLAEALGVTGQAISRWESETGYPDIEYIVPIAKYFNVTTDFLFEHTCQPPIPQLSNESLSRQDVSLLIDNIKQNNPVLVEELIPKHMSIGDIRKVLAKLLKENIPICDLVSILETLADYAPVTNDTDMLTDYVRAGLRNTISRKFFHQGENLVITLCQKLEQTLIENITKTETGSFVNIEHELCRQIFESLKTETGKLTAANAPQIILTSPFIRLYFKQLVEEVAPDLHVISYGEIEGDTNIMSVGMVSV